MFQGPQIISINLSSTQWALQCEDNQAEGDKTLSKEIAYITDYI